MELTNEIAFGLNQDILESMSKRLPSLTALRTLEAAARHKSFSKAGEELAVTPAAVGFQIKQLEDEIGAKLFIRKHRAVELTPTGRALAEKLAPAFQDISSAWQDLHMPEFTSPLRITASDPVSLDWLIPTIDAAKKQGAAPEIVLETSRELRDLEADNWDVAIRTGYGPYPPYFCESLLRKWHTPLMRPELAKNVQSVEDLLNFDLIQTMNKAEDVWRNYFRQLNLPGEPDYATACENPRLALELAAAGEYVTIGGHFHAEKYLAAGTLVSPLPYAIVYVSRIWLLCKRGQENSDEVKWLRDILHADADRIRARAEGFEFFDYDGNIVPSLT